MPRACVALVVVMLAGCVSTRSSETPSPYKSPNAGIDLGMSLDDFRTMRPEAELSSDHLEGNLLVEDERTWNTKPGTPVTATWCYWFRDGELWAYWERSGRFHTSRGIRNLVGRGGTTDRGGDEFTDLEMRLYQLEQQEIEQGRRIRELEAELDR